MYGFFHSNFVAFFSCIQGIFYFRAHSGLEGQELWTEVNNNQAFSVTAHAFKKFWAYCIYTVQSISVFFPFTFPPIWVWWSFGKENNEEWPMWTKLNCCLRTSFLSQKEFSIIMSFKQRTISVAHLQYKSLCLFFA